MSQKKVEYNDLMSQALFYIALCNIKREDLHGDEHIRLLLMTVPALICCWEINHAHPCVLN